MYDVFYFLVERGLIGGGHFFGLTRVEPSEKCFFKAGLIMKGWLKCWVFAAGLSGQVGFGLLVRDGGFPLAGAGQSLLDQGFIIKASQIGADQAADILATV